MEYGIDTLPALVYFDKRIPNIYSGDLDTVDILIWMTEQVYRPGDYLDKNLSKSYRQKEVTLRRSLTSCFKH